MHTVEAAVLVPLGLGLVVILMMLTFWTHDRVVLAAECSALMLEWQRLGKLEVEEEQFGQEWESQMLVTELSGLKLISRKAVFCLKVTAERELFRSGFLLTGLNEAEAVLAVEKTLIRTDPCWLKRIWRVSGLK